MENTSIRLQRLINEKNLKQADIITSAAPYCSKYNVKLTKSDLSQFVSGTVIPGTKKLIILSMVLNVSPAWLMGYDVPKTKNTPIITDHEGLQDDYLYAINILLEDTEYSIEYFAKQYQLKSSDDLYKLSPTEVNNLIEECKRQVKFALSEILSNRFHDNIVALGANPDKYALKVAPINSLNTITNAAHGHNDATLEDKQHDENIMNNEDF